MVRPRAGRDLDEQAYYLATQGSAELGHRFLLAAHETFALLATQPEMGWHPRLRHPELVSMRVFRIAGFEKIVVLYRQRGWNGYSARGAWFAKFASAAASRGDSIGKHRDGLRCGRSNGQGRVTMPGLGQRRYEYV